MSITEPAVPVCPHCGSACASENQYCPACGFPVGSMAGSTEDKLIGKTLPGGYHILDLISVGGMGRVYRAQQSALGRTVAVKIIHPHLLADENSALRFMTEARAASQLNHPNSLAVFDFGRTDDGQPYLVMEFLRGKDLARVTYEEGPLTFSRVVDVLRQTLAALGEAHELGIVHRDLKPENIVLEPLRRGGDFVKVVDFGLAKLRADAQSPGVTDPGIVCGTPDYMAPEQGRGDAIDGRSDLYAMGVILFQLLTGQLPFNAENPTQVVMMHLTVPVPDPRQVAPQRHIPDPFVHVTMKALAKNADERYQDASEFSEALRTALMVVESQPPDRPSLPVGALVTCPKCSATVPVTRFCGECGARLPVPSGAPESAAGPTVLPFLARQEELGFFDEYRRGVVDGTRGLRIVGEPGAGKTRLLQELLTLARADGDLVVVAGPDPFHAEVGYSALRDAVRELAGLRQGDIDVASFPDTEPDVATGLSQIFAKQSPNAQLSPEERRSAAARALRWAMDVASGRAERVVLAIDDLDDVDGASRNAFADVLGTSSRGPVLIVTAHTPGFDTGWGARAVARVVGGLPPPAVSRLLSGTPSGDRLTLGPTLLPMYVEHVIRYAQEGGTDPPARLADLVALRIDLLEADSRRALQAIAVLGNRTEKEAVAELLPKLERLDAAIDKLVRAGLVRMVEGRLGVAQPLLREIVLSSIPVTARRELHGRALALAEAQGLPLEAQALHAVESGESFQALFLLEQVADRAMARNDQKSEILALRRGLDLARQEISRGELDDPLRAVLIFSQKLGSALIRTGSLVDAEGVLREALDLAGPQSPDRARVLSALARVAHGRHRETEANDYMEQAITVAKQSGAIDLASSFSEARRSWSSAS